MNTSFMLGVLVEVLIIIPINGAIHAPKELYPPASDILLAPVCGEPTKMRYGFPATCKTVNPVPIITTARETRVILLSFTPGTMKNTEEAEIRRPMKKLFLNPIFLIKKAAGIAIMKYDPNSR